MDNNQDLISSSKNLQLLLRLCRSFRLFGHVASVHVQPFLQGLYAILLGGQVSSVVRKPSLKPNLWTRRKYGQVTLYIVAVQGEKALVLDIPPRPAELKFTR